MKSAPDMIAAELHDTRIEIRAALRAGNMKQAQLLVSKAVGLRICAGEIVVKLKRREWN